MSKAVIIEDREHIGACDAVISAECCSLCVEIISFDLEVQRICEEVVGGFRCLRADHIYMALKDRDG